MSDTLTEFELQLVTFLDQQYQLTGELLTAERALKDYGIPTPKFNKAFEKDKFKEALTERGIVFERFNKDDWTSKSLTPTQLLLANTLLDITDTRTNKKKCQDLGVSTIQYTAWMKDPVFKDYMGRRAEQLMGENEHEIKLALMDRARAGDMKAISFWYEVTGRYIPVSRTQSGNVDIQAILVKVIEIINEEVNDQATMEAISNRLRALIGANNIARALTEEEPIVVPEVVSIRSVPKELVGSVDREPNV